MRGQGLPGQGVAQSFRRHCPRRQMRQRCGGAAAGICSHLGHPGRSWQPSPAIAIVLVSICSQGHMNWRGGGGCVCNHFPRTRTYGAEYLSEIASVTQRALFNLVFNFL